MMFVALKKVVLYLRLLFLLLLSSAFGSIIHDLATKKNENIFLQEKEVLPSKLRISFPLLA